jgi:hypothetical protein
VSETAHVDEHRCPSSAGDEVHGSPLECVAERRELVVSDESSSKAIAADVSASEEVAGSNGSRDYTLPIVHVRVPAKAVDVGFWGGLAGAVALGVVDPPLGVLLGAGVVVARHQAKA